MNKFVVLILINIFAATAIYADEPDAEINDYSESDSLNFTGSIRNDALYTHSSNDLFNDILEGKMTLEKKAEKWTVFTDGRVYILYGDNVDENEDTDWKLMRMYGRYYTNFASTEITIGKTFINMGIDSVFNPFSINKSVNYSDISYDKEGLISGEIKYFPGNLTEGNLFVSYMPARSNYIYGSMISTNAGSFDFGLAVMRLMHDRKDSFLTALVEDHNKAGFFFKGDLLLGIQASYAFHFNDGVDNYFHEANAGLDYSLFSGKLFLETLVYYNEAGEMDRDNYTVVVDSQYKAKYYDYSAVNLKISEFFSTGMSGFVNLCDYSYMVIPYMKFQPANGLTVSLQGAYISGKGNSEFNQNLYGEYSLLLRTEIIF